jgi:Cdc6-like AAA superfamily ATPase
VSGLILLLPYFFPVLDGRTNNRLFAVRSNFTTRSSIPVMLPVKQFVGRDKELKRIHKELQYDGSRKTVVLHGLGGMGKTQLALAYVQQQKDKYSAVFWINSKDVDTLKQGYVTAAKRISSDHPSLAFIMSFVDGGNPDETIEAVKQWLSSARNDRWLIIYDNYDTPNLPGRNDSGAFDIRPFLPEKQHGAILLTTRSSYLKWWPSVKIKKLQNIEHSLEILTHMSGREGLSSGKGTSLY